MKVLITGGMGVIGAETSRKFVHEGHRPVVYARHRDDRLIGDILDRIDFEAGDILDMPRLLDVIKRHRVTHIVHAAAFVGAVSAANPALSIQVNVMGTVNVLEAARLFDIKRLVYTSAKGIYGPILGDYGPPNYKPIPEDMPKNPQRIYDSAKLMSEQTVLYYAKEMGLDTAVLRFSTTYGPGQDGAPWQDGRDQPDRREPVPRAVVSSRRRRCERRFHLQQGLGARDLSRDDRRQGSEPCLQYRQRYRSEPE
jgi:UDP-glucose 4-epimerase